MNINQKAQNKWSNLIAEARLAYPKSPEASLLLYKTAIVECRRIVGPNDEELAHIFEEAAHVCFMLERDAESQKYRSKADQIRIFNAQQQRRFHIQQTALF